MYKYEHKILEVKRSAETVEQAIRYWSTFPGSDQIIDNIAPEASHTVILINELLDDMYQDYPNLKPEQKEEQTLVEQ